LQVGKDADRPPGLFLQRADDLHARQMAAALAMAEIKAEDVDAGME
jgi:hypothetical protein